MKIEELNVTIGCDMPMCKNVAKYSIKTGENMISKNINICPDCLNKLYKEIAKVKVAKSPQNVIKKAQNRSSKL